MNYRNKKAANKLAAFFLEFNIKFYLSSYFLPSQTSKDLVLSAT